MWAQIKRYLLPLALGLLGLLLLARVLFTDTFILVPEDVDVILLVALLSIAMVAAIHTIVRISMNHLRQRSIQQVRRETLAEHRRFLSRLDHEFKNPLTALRAGLQTLELTPLTPQQQHIVAVMAAETLRLSRLIADLRKLAELEAQPLNLQPVSLPALITETVQLERERFEAGQRFLTYETDLAQEVWLVDEDLLALALHNLLDNAYKYTNAGDHIRVIASGHQELLIGVSDTGIGIPPAELAHVWEELYRSQQLEKIAGSGTGLALVKAIAERHGGEATIESTVGEGTTVLLRLPLFQS
ncbi:MAG: hypothetical protein DCC57_01635 [Chloroflexi bacterium]|nr:MAG: hypothetical protein DCC57_01635 [Chloroflexota bacterium]